MTKSVLVTGGAGYLGSALVERLIRAGHSCRVLDIVGIEEPSVDLEFIRGDIRDPRVVARACDGVEVVYHCVAQVPIVRDSGLFESVNVGGMENLVSAAAASSVRKIVVLSSSAVFGIPSRLPVDEETPPRPMESYGRAKLAAEQVAIRANRELGLEMSIIRPRTIVGRGRLGIFHLLFDWIADGKAVYVLGDGSNLYQFIHVDDLAIACMRAAGEPGFAVYNIGTDRFGTMRESIQAVVNHADMGSTVRSIPMRPAALAMAALSKLRMAPFAPYHHLMYGRDLYFDISRATRELGWQPRWSNAEMLIQSYDWFIEHRAEIRNGGDSSAHRSPVKQGVLRVLKWLS